MPRSAAGESLWARRDVAGVCALLMALALAAFAVGAVLWYAVPARAQSNPPNTIIVNTVDDEDNADGDCSLREAIKAANTNQAVDACPAGSNSGEDEVIFDTGSSEPIKLSSQLRISDTVGLAIDGENSNNPNVQVSGDGVARVFLVDTEAWRDPNAPVAKFTLSNLTVEEGRPGLVDDCGNELYGCMGGGLLNVNGTVTVQDSTFSGNHAGNWSGGGIANWDGTLTVQNSTISGNSADVGGGGIHNIAFAGSSTLTVQNSTISGNSVIGDGGGISNTREPGASSDPSKVQATATLESTIVADNSTDNGGGANCSVLGAAAPITDGGYNLSSDASCGFATENNSLSDTDPLLGPLQGNGGPTMTHALLEDSPAIGAGNPAAPGSETEGACSASDQRGAPRNDCDVGAYELVRCAGAVVNVVGTPGPDVLSGGTSDDAVRALAGDDEISGMGGEDVICGGKGDDALRGGTGDDRLFGRRGSDTLYTRDGVRANDLANGGLSTRDVCKTDPKDRKLRCP